jgi:hypothetical protein
MSQPTPGPWWYDVELESVFAASGPIARAEPASGPLMAAAPDLLEALSLLLGQVVAADPDHVSGVFGTEAIEQASAALAKAWGES